MHVNSILQANKIKISMIGVIEVMDLQVHLDYV